MIRRDVSKRKYMCMENRKVQRSSTRITEAISESAAANDPDGGWSRRLVVDGSLAAGAAGFVRSL
jgi:hypothetical protein